MENKMDKTVSIYADFSEEMKNSLIKSKFGVYVCSYVEARRMIRDIEKLKELKPGGFRYDPGWGFGNNDRLNSPREFNAPQISGRENALKINFTDFDRLTERLQKLETDIMYVHAYNPLPLQNIFNADDLTMSSTLHRNSNWNTKPNNMEAWEEINYKYAAHWKEKGWKVKYYEVWNEPDLQTVFFNGAKEDFFEIYKYGVRGIKRADPYALVGGPALSFDKTWIRPFLIYVKKNLLPLDFFSFHAYGNPKHALEEMKEMINSVSGFEDINIQMTEYNSFIPATKNFTTMGEIERYHAAAKMLHDFMFFLEQPQIKKVYWAQLNDPEVFGEGVDRCGLISMDGHKKASFNAYKIYADMPEKRNKMRTDSGCINGFASSDELRACLVLWNMSDSCREIDVCMERLSFRAGLLEVFRIDESHGSYMDNPDDEELSAVEKFHYSGEKLIKWRGRISAGSVVYLVIKAAGQKI